MFLLARPSQDAPTTVSHSINRAGGSLLVVNFFFVPYWLCHFVILTETSITWWDRKDKGDVSITPRPVIKLSANTYNTVILATWWVNNGLTNQIIYPRIAQLFVIIVYRTRPRSWCNLQIIKYNVLCNVFMTPGPAFDCIKFWLVNLFRWLATSNHSLCFRAPATDQQLYNCVQPRLN